MGAHIVYCCIREYEVVQYDNHWVFILHVLDNVVLANQLRITVRALEVLLFQTVLILNAHLHVADHLVLATALLTTVVAAKLVFLRNVLGLHALVHVTDHIFFCLRINFHRQNSKDFHIQSQSFFFVIFKTFKVGLCFKSVQECFNRVVFLY